MNLKFLKLGGRHIVIDDQPKMTKREVLSKIAAMFTILEEATPAERAFFSKVDTSTWSKEKVDRVWADLRSMKAKGAFDKL